MRRLALPPREETGTLGLCAPGIPQPGVRPCPPHAPAPPPAQGQSSVFLWLWNTISLVLLPVAGQYAIASLGCPRGAQTDCPPQEPCGGRCSAKLNECYGSLALLSSAGKKLPSCEVLQSQTASTRKQVAPGGTQEAASRDKASTFSH